ncbi:MAG: hypothetical protein WEA34_09590 [Gemmatimonadota bacterium]
MKSSIYTLRVVVLCLSAALGCGDRPSDRGLAVSRARFVDTYVDLRAEALRAESEMLTDSARATVLARHGVTEEELLDFAEAMGGDLDYMRDLWNEIELRLDSLPPVMDSAR